MMKSRKNCGKNDEGQKEFKETKKLETDATNTVYNILASLRWKIKKRDTMRIEPKAEK